MYDFQLTHPSFTNITQSSKKQKVKPFARAIIAEISSRYNAIANTDVENRDVLLGECELLKKHVDLYIQNCSKGARASKNVLRVMIGIDPVPAKIPSDPLFPAEEKKSVAKSAKSVLNKLSKKKATPAESALNKALTQLQEIADEKDESGIIRLTSTEILMLTVMSSQGMPVFCDNYSSLINRETILNDDIATDEDYQTYFFAMGGVMHAAAEVWKKVAEKKLRDKVEAFTANATASNSTKQMIMDEVATLQRDLDNKKLTLEDSKEFSKVR